MRPDPRRPAARPARTAAVLVVLLAVLGVSASCGSMPPTQGPTGVDGLRIPTPAPEPADFVAGIDNEWLPLAPGTVWAYRPAGGSAGSAGSGGSDGSGGTLTVRVLPGTRPVAGVPTTVVRWVLAGEGRPPRREDRLYAQDLAGNVWLFGTGRPGASAGLAMPAAPRIGDGYLRVAAPGEARERVTVVALDAAAGVPYDEDLDGLLETEVSDGSSPGKVVEETYAPGVGLVRLGPLAGRTWELVSVRQG